MYRGFAGTVLSHLISLLSTVWAILRVCSCNVEPADIRSILCSFIFVGSNCSLAVLRYGLSDGYKLRRAHIVMLNLSTILHFTITETTFLQINNLSLMCQWFPALNIIPLLSNSLAKDYRVKLKLTDIFIAMNCMLFLLFAIFFENYYGVCLTLSFFFGYFVIGECGYFLDTEVPSVDAFQYLTCFLNFFSVYTLCY